MALLGTFFYPWYGNAGHNWRHWNGNSHHPPSTWASNFLPDNNNKPPSSSSFDPALDLYDSNSKDTIIWQLGGMKRAGIEFAISSWWGKQDYTDNALQNVLSTMKVRENPHPLLKWAIYYEKEGYRKDLGTAEIVSDLNYISQRYSSDQSILKIDGKTVVFVYSTSDSSDSYVERWAQAKSQVGDVYIVLKVVQNYKANAHLVDSWHQYAPANRFSVHSPYSAFVSPGFWKYHEAPRLSRDTSQFREAVRQMKSTNVQFWLVETWNEFHEGTMVEPAWQINHDDSTPPFKESRISYGDDFIDVIKD